VLVLTGSLTHPSIRAVGKQPIAVWFLQSYALFALLLSFMLTSDLPRAWLTVTIARLKTKRCVPGRSPDLRRNDVWLLWTADVHGYERG
jgi:hypothetical protein